MTARVVNILSLEGVKSTVLPVGESGYNPYEVVVTTRESYLLKNPSVVAAVRRALRKGWAAYLKDPHRINTHLSTLNPAMSLEAMDLAATAATPYVEGPQALGTMTLKRWKTLAKQLKEIGVLTKDIDPRYLFWHLKD